MRERGERERERGGGGGVEGEGGKGEGGTGERDPLDNVLFYAVGSIPESDEGKLYNTCTVFNPSGEMLGKYRKV